MNSRAAWPMPSELNAGFPAVVRICPPELRTSAYQGVEVPSRIFRGSPIGYFTTPAFFTARASVSTSSQVLGGAVIPAFFSMLMSTSVPRKSSEYGTPIWWPPCTNVGAPTESFSCAGVRYLSSELNQPAAPNCDTHVQSISTTSAGAWPLASVVTTLSWMESHASVCMSTLMPVFCVNCFSTEDLNEPHGGIITV